MSFMLRSAVEEGVWVQHTKEIGRGRIRKKAPTLQFKTALENSVGMLTQIGLFTLGLRLRMVFVYSPIN
jgi:hypothetical protein